MLHMLRAHPGRIFSPARVQDKLRRFESVDPAAFMAMVKGLNASAVDLTVEETKVAGKVEGKKAAAKSKPAGTKKVTVRKSTEATPEMVQEAVQEAKPEAIQAESEAATSR